MSDLRSSSDFQSLLDAAKADAPSAAARANVWAGVSGALGSAAAAGGGVGGAAAGLGGLGAAKMLVIGTLLGGTMTVGLAAAVLYQRPAQNGPLAGLAAVLAEHRGPSSVRSPVTVPEIEVATQSAPPTLPTLTAPVTVIAETGGVGPGALPVVNPSRDRAKLAGVAHRHGAVVDPAKVGSAVPSTAGGEDDLVREASLLSRAQGALARRNAAEALQAIRATARLPERQLIPEELALEAQALRMLGLTDEASGKETELKTRYPESALAK